MPENNIAARAGEASGVDRFAGVFQRMAPAVFLGVLLILKIHYARHLDIDSDEPAHLHVTWSWTQGLIQYRDVFSNNAPLFQILWSPLMRLFGERADIFIPMRMTVIPLFFACLWCVYRTASAFEANAARNRPFAPGIDARAAGLWAAVFCGLLPDFFFVSTEFRTDDLWTALWLMAVTVFVGGVGGWRVRVFLAGLFFGGALAASMKTSLLAVSVSMAAIIVFVLGCATGERIAWAKVRGGIIPGFAGFALIPLALILFYAGASALGPLYYGTIEHNIVPGLGNWQRFDPHRLEWAMKVALWSLGALGLEVLLTRRRPAWSRLFLVLTGSIFLLLLDGGWPLLTRQDYLPALPLFYMALTPVAGAILGRVFSFGRIGTLICVAGLAFLGAREVKNLKRRCPPPINEIAETIRNLGSVLALTHRDEFVMDAKGETIFRRRPFFHALEGITLRRIELGWIRDDLPERLIETHTFVINGQVERIMPSEAKSGLNYSATIDRFPVRDRKFIDLNYLPVADNMMVAGKFLPQSGPDGGIPFQVEIAADYAIIGERDPITGLLDGKSYEGGAIRLESGRHEFHPGAPGGGQMAVFWGRASQSGLTPFRAGAGK